MLVTLLRHLELHGSHVFDCVTHVRLNHRPRDLAITTGLCDSLLRKTLEMTDNTHHTDGFDQWASEVVIRKAVLLQEILTNDLGHFQCHLLILGQGILPDQLHDLLQVVLHLEHFAHALLQRPVLRVEILLEIRLQSPDILGERDVPIDRRKVLALRKLLVQSPEHLHNRQSGGSHRISEITARRRHGAHDRDRPLTIGAAQARHTSCSLIERRQARPQVGRIPGISRHFCQTPRHLTQSLGPPRG
mmetsp:Transcript_25331/g.55727  ORF Transcript_25331/g.55727 Transcript_25331/m.55727 type:complete len:246 (-) Transcript_25331:1076-1813(-)